jgi:hypothetical protein
MPKHHRILTRSLAAGLAVCAIAPGTALAVPAIDGPGASPDSGPPVSAQQDLRAPDQTGSRPDGATKQDLEITGEIRWPRLARYRWPSPKPRTCHGPETPAKTRERSVAFGGTRGTCRESGSRVHRQGG